LKIAMQMCLNRGGAARRGEMDAKKEEGDVKFGHWRDKCFSTGVKCKGEELEKAKRGSHRKGHAQKKNF